MRKHIQTIHIQLFLYYSIFILFLITVIVGGFYFYISTDLKERAYESLYETTLRIQEQVDNEIRIMNDISIRIFYSNLIKDRFEIYLSESSPSEGFTNQLILRDIFMAIMGPMQPVFQINLYDLTGEVIGAGYFNSVTRVNLKDISWLEKTRSAEGAKIITAPPYNKNKFNKPVISLCRVFYDNFNIESGYIEVIQEYETVFKGPLSENSDPDIYIYNEEGILLFPENSRGVSNPDQILAGENTVRNPDSGEDEIAVASLSEYNNWIVIAVISKNKLLLNLRLITRSILIILLIALSASLLISYFLSRRITQPINQIHQTIKEINLETLSPTALLPLNSGFNELEELQQAFNKMNIRLKQSMEETLILKTQELQARMLALQAQMNPHFLYNTISNISIMAEENSTDEIIHICEELSSMLRYVSGNDQTPTTLKQEIDHMLNYLRLMKYRYLEKIEFTVDIPESMFSIVIGKLMIQPLVENALKYGTNIDPPWKIFVRGRIEQNLWILEIQDNGHGFESHTLDKLRGQINDPELKLIIPSLQLEGMGILNIAARLQLLYGSNAIMKLQNLSQGGASITLGGSFI